MKATYNKSSHLDAQTRFNRYANEYGWQRLENGATTLFDRNGSALLEMSVKDACCRNSCATY